MLYNNQDAYKVHQEEELLVAVVCDGCGSSSGSEIGAKLTAEFVVNYCVKNFRTSVFNADLLTEALLDFYKHCVHLLSADPAVFIKEHFYTTIVGCIISESGTLMFSAGDGILVADKHIKSIDQQNAPQYLAYNLTEQKDYKFNVHEIPDKKISRLLIATDGLEDLWTEGQEQNVLETLFAENHFTNEVALSKYLSEQNSLFDDTTVVMIKA